jgi:hypothetical protein
MIRHGLMYVRFILILDAGWTTGGREVGSTTRLDFSCLLTVGELVRNRMKMSDV